MGNTYDYKAVDIGAVDVVDEGNGVVSTIVSVTGVKDNVNDIITPGAYEKTLKVRTPKGIWHHDWKQPISKTLESRELLPGDSELPKAMPNGDAWPSEAGGLLIKTEFNMKTQAGRDAYENVKFFGADQEWSIGYKVEKSRREAKTGTRIIDQLALYEYSPVLVGAMPLAHTTKLKSDEESSGIKEAQAAWKEFSTKETEAEGEENEDFSTGDGDGSTTEDTESTPTPLATTPTEVVPDADDEEGETSEEGSEDADDPKSSDEDEAKEGALDTDEFVALINDLIPKVAELEKYLQYAKNRDQGRTAEDEDPAKPENADKGYDDLYSAVIDVVAKADNINPKFAYELKTQALMFDTVYEKEDDVAKIEEKSEAFLDVLDLVADLPSDQKVLFAPIVNQLAEMLKPSTGETKKTGARTTDERDKMSETGNALPDGSFPIADRSELRKAIQAFGRAKDKAAAKRHIIKRARALKSEWMLPDGWSGSKEAQEEDTEVKMVTVPISELGFDLDGLKSFLDD